VTFPRITVASIAFVVLIAAIDFGVIRAVLRAQDINDWELQVFLLLPMIDALLIVAYRLRRPERRTRRASGFLIAGSVATAFTFVSGYVAPESIITMISAVGEPLATAILKGLTHWIGAAAIQTGPIQLVLAICFELLLPVALVCGPALIVAVCGSWLAGRARQPGLDQVPLPGTLVA
jgi:hypothetical protein